MARLSIVLTQEQFNKLDKILPWGTKQPVMSHLVDQLINVVEAHGAIVLGPIIKGEFNLVSSIVKTMEEKE